MPRRVGGLWPRVVDPANLLAAARAALRAKRFSAAALRFAADLELELPRLGAALEAGTYAPGAYRTFWIRDPKPRLISAAPFRDRVVHHAVMRVVAPVLDRRLVPWTFANREGLGSHAALRLARRHLARSRYVLRLDVARFFPSIDHAVCLGLVARTIKCRQTLDLLAVILAASPPQEDVGWLFPDEEHRAGPRERLEPAAGRRGLPIGNLTSQHLANYVLSPVDRRATADLGLDRYIRYMDDVLVFDDDRERLRAAQVELTRALTALRLRPHAAKTRVQPTAAGIRFLGFDLWPTRARVAAPALRRARRRLHAQARATARAAVRAAADQAAWETSASPAAAAASGPPSGPPSGRMPGRCPSRESDSVLDKAGRFAAWAGHARHADARGLLSRLRADLDAREARRA